ncbi:MAG TPA: glycosyltransferase [Bacteroidia bacterium]
MKDTVEIIIWIIFIFCVSIMSAYLILASISIVALKKYLRKNSFSDYKSVLNSSFAPPISIIAPAYNEGKTIVDNAKSLLALHYNNFEVLIINDGSKDDTLQKMIEAFDLQLLQVPVNIQIECKEIRGVYKSSNPAFKKLSVIDKVNGGKADALNAGINVATAPYITCIDVDCVLEQDSLIKMVKPFLEATKKRVIASGGVVRIANSCIIENGRLINVEVPDTFIARVQVLEYIRAFLLGRMAWSQMDGLLLISGAFGMFDKEIVIKAGGYYHKTVGEDMELVVRMRRYMHDNKLPYTVTFIPDPLCWTEAPEDFKILGRQRSRWTRGTIETLWLHREMLFHPKYRILGLLSYPFWLVYEYLAPIIEATGLIFSIILACFGLINWHFFMLLIIFVYTFAILFSMLSLLTEETTYYQYTKRKDYMKLVYAALLEPIFFHPFVVYSAIKGNIDLIKGKKTWGDMTRKGLSKQ